MKSVSAHLALVSFPLTSGAPILLLLPISTPAPAQLDYVANEYLVFASGRSS